MYVIIHSFFYDKKKKIKTKIIRILFLLILLIIFGTIFYGSFIEPQLIIKRNYDINLNKTEQTEHIKAIFLTDIHVGRFKNDIFVQRVVNIVKKENPDIILLGGDYLLDKEKHAIDLHPLFQLAKTIPTFAVLGNHEYNQANYNDPSYDDRTKLIKQLFNDWNINLLINQNKTITINNSELSILGIDDLYTLTDDLNQAKKNIDNDIPKILLSHNPNIIAYDNFSEIDLTLSGHTHAGQIRLPIIGSVPNIPTSLGRKFDYGLFNLKQKGQLLISAGLGESGTRARLFNNPEITIIDLDL